MARRSAAVRLLAIVIIEPVSMAASTRSAGIELERVASGRAVGAGVVTLRAGSLVERRRRQALCAWARCEARTKTS